VKNVLIISYFAPPLNIPSSVRTGKLAKHFLTLGWNPIIISVKDIGFYFKDYSLSEEIKNIEIIRTESLDPQRVIKKLRKKTHSSVSERLYKDKENFIYKFKSFFPIDDKIGWIPFCYKAAKKNILTHKIDAIYTFVGGVNHPAITAYYLSKRFDIPFFVEFHDLWADHPFYPRTKIGQKLNDFWERKVLLRAAGVITLAPGSKKILQEKYEFLKERIIFNPNGFDAEYFEREFKPKDKNEKSIVITFCGHLYKNMTPSDIFKAILEYDELDLPLKLRFIGDFRKAFRVLKEQFEQRVKNRDITIDVLPRMPYDLLLEELHKSDAFMLFLPNEEKFKPILHAKLYDYLAVGKPILAFVPLESDVESFIKMGNLGYVAEAGNPESGKKIIKQFITEFKQNKLSKYKASSGYVRKYSRHEAARKILEFMEDKLESRKKSIKKIAVVSNTAWSIFNFRSGLMKKLDEQGYKIITIAPFDEYAHKILYEYHKIKMNNKGTNPFEDFILFLRFFFLYRKLKPDVILHFTPKPNIYGTFAAKLLRKPCVNNIAGLGTTFIRESLVTKIVRTLYCISQKSTQKIFFQNREDRAIFQKLGIFENTDLLPGSGIDTNKFIPKKKKEQNNFAFLLHSRLIWDKGVGEFVDAARRIKRKKPDVKFQILGFLDVENTSAIPKEQMNKWVDEGVIDYLGEVCDVREYIANSDCVVLPSYYREGVPRSLLEAASMAKPIITTNNVGCKNVVDEGITGFLCEIKSVDDLVDKMEQMLRLTKKTRCEMGKKGREKIIREFDEQIVFKKYVEAINEVTK